MTRRRNIARVLVGLVLVAGSALGAFGHDARTPDREPVVFICTPSKPRCIAMATEADR